MLLPVDMDQLFDIKYLKRDRVTLTQDYVLVIGKDTANNNQIFVSFIPQMGKANVDYVRGI